MIDDYLRRFKELIASASDKEIVKISIGARLYANATMSGNPNLPKSSKDMEIEEIIHEFEGDADISAELTTRVRKIRTYSQRR
jgi:hypothetical protein